MYRAKASGKGRYAVFEPGMHTAIVDRLELEVDLKRALEREELALAYQPIFSLRQRGVGESRRWFAGGTRRAGWCCPRASSRWPRRAA